MVVGPLAEISVPPHALSEAYLNLVANWALWNGPLDSALRHIAEAAAAALDVERAGIWTFSEDRSALTLLCQFDRRHNEHLHGSELQQSAFPNYFASLERSRIVDASDIIQDPRTRELGPYATAFGITALLDATVRSGGNIWGVVCHEYRAGARRWTRAEHWFATSVADFIGQLVRVEETQKNLARLGLIAQNLPVGVLRIDTEARALFVNPHWLSLAGAAAGSVRERSWLEAVHSDDRARLLAELEQAWQQDERFETECRFQVNGQILWIFVRWVIERDPSGFPLGALGSFIDVSARHRAEQLARREQALILKITQGIAAATGEQFFNNLTEQLADALDVDFAFVGELLPTTPAQVRTIAVHAHGKPAANFSYALTGTPCEQVFDTELCCIAEGAQQRFPLDTMLADFGVESYLGIPLTAVNGKTLGIIVVLHSAPLADTALAGNLLRIFAVRAATELERRVQELELRDNERRYHALFDHSADAIFLLEDDRFVDCNERTLRMFHCTREQIIGQPPYHYSPEMQPDGTPSQQKALETIAGAHRGDNQTFDWQHLREDGSAFDAEVTLASLSLAGKPYLLATVRDISDRKQAERELKANNERLRWINQVATRLYAKRDVQGIAQESAALLSDHSSSPLVSFYIFNDGPGRATLVAEHGSTRRTDRVVGTTYPIQAIPDDMDEVAYYSDIVDNTYLPAETRAALRGRGVRDLVYLLLKYHGEMLGQITLDYTESIEFGAAEYGDLLAFGKTVSMALANARYVTDMEFQANYDVLTGLHNRYALQGELARLTQQTEPLALMLLDLDRFKEVNDTLGHHIGDKLLRMVGARLRDALAGDDAFLARLGGDEFAVLLRRNDGEKALNILAKHILNALKLPYSVDGLALEIGASIGIASFPLHGSNGHELLRSADVAMYAAKERRVGVLLYDAALDQNSPDRLALLSELSAGISRGELVLHYQPKTDLGDGRVIGCEALVRWQHPRRGLLAPDQFIAVAEMSDVIHPLTMEVLRQALQQQQLWRTAGLPHAVSVNLSARNLLEENFVENLEEVLQQQQADPCALELEITESALMHDPERAADLLQRVAKLGVKLSIDDFGMGYSSLTYLRRLPISTLKIDRTFVMDMATSEQDAIIVRSTIALAHNLGVKVVAEGVENAATLSLLRVMQCDFAQGYHISRPQPAAQLEQWLRAAAQQLRSGSD
jgi:diguanylate cyclase (GGDEF)-like protein/PAS domain S-box-containing protein